MGVTVQVVEPNGELACPDVTIVPNISENPQTEFEYIYSLALPQAGGYLATWIIQDQVEIHRPNETFFASYTDVETQVRDLLLQTQVNAPDLRLDRELTQALRIIRLIYPTFDAVGGYDALALDDQQLMDRALAYTVAAALRPWLAKTQGSFFGDIALVRQVGVEYRAQLKTIKQDKTPEQILLDTAWESLRNIACIKLATAQAWAARTPLGLVGPRRTAQHQGRYQALLNPLWNLIADEPFFYTWYYNYHYSPPAYQGLTPNGTNF